METTQTKQPGCNIFLIGFMGAGKSTIAAELKRQLQLELIEMDQLIEEQQGMPRIISGNWKQICWSAFRTKPTP